MRELLKHELFKILNRKILWFAALFFALITIFFVCNMTGIISRPFGNMNDFYHTTYENREGAVDTGAAATAQTDINVLTNSPNSKDTERQKDYDNAVLNAKADQDRRTSRLSEFKNAMNTAQSEQGKNSFAYRNAALHYSMIKQLVMPGVYFTYPWKNIIDFPTVLGFLIIVAMVLLGVSPIFSDEYASGLDALILSSKNGRRKITGAKIIACMLYCAAAALIFTLVNMAGYFAALGTIGFDAPIQSIYTYLASPYGLTVGQYFLAQTVVAVVGSISFGLLVLLISVLSKSALIPFFTCGCLVGLTTIIKVMNLTLPGYFSWFVDFSYSELIRVEGLFSTFKTYNIFGYPMPYLNMMAVVAVCVSLVSIFLTFKVFRRHQVN
jgi:ABC-type transport system involved in multi-copper enzyme maturation permease subunit